MGKNYFDGLTGLRGILSLWVVFGHVLFNSGYRPRNYSSPTSWLINPTTPVYGFMILSGFVITHLIVTKREPYGLYLWRRWLRLFPLLCVCTCATLAIGIEAPRVFPHIMNRWEQLPAYMSSTLSMFQGAIPNRWLNHASTGILPPAWSTSLEWQFYLFAPLLVWPILTKRYWLLAGMVAAAVPMIGGHHVIAGKVWHWGHGSFLPNSVFYFLLGIAGYAVFQARPALMGVFNVLAHPRLVELGNISYSVYLTHIIVLHSVRVFILPDSVPVTGPERLLWLGSLTVAITLCVAAITYRYIETPFMNLGRGKPMFRRPSLKPAG